MNIVRYIKVSNISPIYCYFQHILTSANRNREIFFMSKNEQYATGVCTSLVESKDERRLQKALGPFAA